MAGTGVPMSSAWSAVPAHGATSDVTIVHPAQTLTFLGSRRLRPAAGSAGRDVTVLEGSSSALVADPAPGAPRSTWQVTYNGFSPAAQTAFQASVDIWARLVSSTVPIKVTANFASLGPGVLGSAGATANMQSATIGDGTSFYPSALADALTGSDRYVGQPDIAAQFSSTYPFYFGTDGATPADQIDFESVVLHELGHGLGFAGFMTDSGGSGSYQVTGRYDAFTYDAATAGSRLTTYTAPNTPSAPLGGVLTGGSVYWGGAAGMASAGGVRPRLFAPTDWMPGSSYSHLDESTYPFEDANALMTYAIAPGEAVHSPGPIVIGMFNDMGWRDHLAGAVTTPDEPTAVTAIPGDGQATVTWTPGAANGSALVRNTVTAYPGGQTTVVDGGATTAIVTGLTNGTAYTFKVIATNGIGTTLPVPSSSVVPAPMQLSAAAPGDPVSGQAYAYQLTATGGRATSWSLFSGSLPPGLSLSSDGLLSGTPTSVVASSFQVAANNGLRSVVSAQTSLQVRFQDLPAAAPFASDIYWLTGHGIAAGFADGTFRPVTAVTRQAFAAYLYRYAHAGLDAGPCAAGSSSFPDVPDASPFCADIQWLAGTGVTGGFADGGFHPSAVVSRQATAAFLYRFNHSGLDAGPCTAGTSPFPDVPDASPFCGDVKWLASTSPQALTTGFADGTFRPAATVTRQAAAAYFHRYDGDFSSPVV